MDPSHAPSIPTCQSAQLFCRAVETVLRSENTQLNAAFTSAVANFAAQLDSINPDAADARNQIVAAAKEHFPAAEPEQSREGTGVFIPLQRFPSLHSDSTAGRIVLMIATAGEKLPDHRHRAPKKTSLPGEIMTTLKGAVQFRRAEGNVVHTLVPGDQPEVSNKETDHYFVPQQGLWCGLYYQPAASDWIPTEQSLTSALQIPEFHLAITLVSAIVTDPINAHTEQNFIELMRLLEQLKFPLFSICVHHKITPEHAAVIKALIDTEAELKILTREQETTEAQIQQIRKASQQLPEMLRQQMSDGAEFSEDHVAPEALEQLGKMFGSNGLVVQKMLADGRKAIKAIGERRQATLEKLLVTAATIQAIREYSPPEEF